jgi:hypothetical protein
MDPYYEEDTEALCEIPICCRKGTTNKGNKGDPALKAGKWGTLAKCDIPLVTNI